MKQEIRRFVVLLVLVVASLVLLYYGVSYHDNALQQETRPTLLEQKQ